MSAAIQTEPGFGQRTRAILIRVCMPIGERSVTLPCAKGERIYRVAGRAAWMLDLSSDVGPGWTLEVDYCDLNPLQTVGGLIQDGAVVTLAPE